MANIVNADFLKNFFRKDSIEPLLKKGMPKEAPDQFDFVKCVDWFIKHLEKENTKLQFFTRAQVGKLLGYHEKYINELEIKFNLPKAGFNKYNIFEVVKWFVVYTEQKHKAETERIKAEKPQDLLARKSAELKEIVIQEKNKNLINLSQVKSAWLSEINTISSILDALPIKASTLLLGISSQVKAKEILDELINEIKLKIAKLDLDIDKEEY